MGVVDLTMVICGGNQYVVMESVDEAQRTDGNWLTLTRWDEYVGVNGLYYVRPEEGKNEVRLRTMLVSAVWHETGEEWPRKWIARSSLPATETDAGLTLPVSERRVPRWRRIRRSSTSTA